MNLDAKPVMTERRTALIGAALVAIGPITMALYTPAMPILAEAFGTDRAAIKLTLTAYFASFALTQLICGPLTDAFGRKPVTIAFLGIYIISSVLATYAPTIEWLLAARAVQGVGAAVGITVARAIVRDQYTGKTSARIMNSIGMMLAIGPAVAPTIGGITLELFGWREIFVFMIGYGIISTVCIWLFMTETGQFTDRANIQPRQLVANYLLLLREPKFLQPSLFIAFGIGTIYVFATILPFVLIEKVGLTPTQFGFGMVAQSGSFITGTIVAGRLLKRMEATAFLPVGLIGMTASGILLFASPLLFGPTFLAVMAPVGLFAFSLAMSLPSTFTMALQGYARIAGAASAMMGFLQFSAGLIGSLCAAALSDPMHSLYFVGPAMPLLAVAFYVGIGRHIKANA